MSFAIFNLVEYMPVEIVLIISAGVRTRLTTFDEHFNSWVGLEYKPWDFLFRKRKISNSTSSGVTKFKSKAESGELDLFIISKSMTV